MTERIPVRIALTCVGGRLTYDTIHALRSTEDLAVWILGINGTPGADARVACDAFLVLQDAGTDPDGFASGVVRACRDHGVDLLILCADEEVLAVRQVYAELLANGTRVSSGQDAPIATVTDKLALYQALGHSKVQELRYRAVENLIDLPNAAKAFGFPDKKLVLKPRSGRGSRGVILLDPAAGPFTAMLPNRFCGTCGLDFVADAFRAYDQVFRGYVLMEYIEGDTYDVDVVAEAGRAVRVVTRLRQLKNKFWPTSTGHKIVRHDAVIACVENASQVLGMDGASDFDVIMRGTQPIILDAACRFSGSVGASLPAGINAPAQLVRSRLGLPPRYGVERDNVVVRPFLTMAEIPLANEGDLL